MSKIFGTIAVVLLAAGAFIAHKNQEAYKKEIVTTSRASSIIPCFVGLSLNVHNGKNFSKINITENMIGKKLGEFVPTRSKFSFKKKKLK